MARIVGEVAKIWRYPIKSTGGETVPRSDVDRRGIVGDRLYAVRDSRGKYGSGKNTRRFRRMEGLLHLSSRYLGETAEPLLLDARNRPVADPVGHLRRWLDDEQVDLVRETDVSLFDQLPLSFVTTATMEWLQAALPDTPIDERRFRVNVLVRTPPGTPPFAEDEWLGFGASIGPDLLVSFVRSSERCTMVNDAQRDLPYAPMVLRTVTRLHDNKLDALAVVERPGAIELGQPIILGRRASGRACVPVPSVDHLSDAVDGAPMTDPVDEAGRPGLSPPGALEARPFRVRPLRSSSGGRRGRGG
nr:MOSC N-terminal beta barrel domain-containing protein [uncultured Actinoplanes sp.]